MGNIIIFGTLSKNQNSNNVISLLAPIYNNESKASQSNNIVTAQNNQQAVQTEPTNSPVLIVTPPVRTRAS